MVLGFLLLTAMGGPPLPAWGLKPWVPISLVSVIVLAGMLATKAAIAFSTHRR
jgi:hypothetical protein